MYQYTGRYDNQPSSFFPSSRFQRRKRYSSLRLALLILCGISIILYLTGFTSLASPTLNNDDDDEDELYEGVYPNSLLTLFYPYTLLSDVVLDQPIPLSDIPFFWHLHNTDEKIYKGILRKCYGLELIELDSMEAITKAKEDNIVVELDRFKHVVTSPFIREVSEIFTTDNFGRMICFHRHPLDYDLHPALPTFERKDNWLTRLLSDLHDEDLTFKEMGVAKHVIRQACLAGKIDDMKGSIIRISEHFGWKFVSSMSNEKGEACIDEILHDNPLTQTFLDKESEEWMTFYDNNNFDCEVYELARSTWRAQIQTIVPWEIQLSRDEDDDEEEEDEER